MLRKSAERLIRGSYDFVVYLLGIRKADFNGPTIKIRSMRRRRRRRLCMRRERSLAGIARELCAAT